MSTARHNYLDRELTKLHDAVGNKIAQEYLGHSHIQQLTDTLGHLAVANIRNGVVSIPNDTGDTIPVIAMKYSDRLVLGPQFLVPSDKQRESYIKQMIALGLTSAEAEAGVENIKYPYNPGVNIDTFDKNSGAITMTAAMVSDSKLTSEHYGFKYNPSTKIAKFMLRPLVAVRIDHTDSDVICHELEHNRQKVERPMRFYGSQHDVDMDALKDELHAYHIGAGIRLGMQSIRHDNDPYRQIEVENVRKEYYSDIQNAFIPSEELLDIYRKLGMGGILNSRLNFEQALRNI